MLSLEEGRIRKIRRVNLTAKISPEIILRYVEALFPGRYSASHLDVGWSTQASDSFHRVGSTCWNAGQMQPIHLRLNFDCGQESWARSSKSLCIRVQESPTTRRRPFINDIFFLDLDSVPVTRASTLQAMCRVVRGTLPA